MDFVGDGLRFPAAAAELGEAGVHCRVVRVHCHLFLVSVLFGIVRLCDNVYTNL